LANLLPSDLRLARAYARVFLNSRRLRRFVVLERLPLTPNGKVDRRARNGPEIADSQLPEEAVNVFAESDVIHKSVPVKEPRA
jgi:hypothetical protein